MEDPAPVKPSRFPALVRIAAGIALFVAFFVCFDRLLFRGLKPVADSYYTSLAMKIFPIKEALGSGKGEALILGSSRTRRAINYQQISPVLKTRILVEAQAGIFPQYIYYFYKKFRQTRGRPALVVIGVDYFEFEKESSLRLFLKIDRGTRLNILDPESAVNPAFPALSRLSWLFRLKPQFDDFLMDAMKFDRGEGDAEPAPAVVDPEAAAAIAPPLQPAKRAYQPFPGVEGRFLKALLDDLESDHVPSFLVLIPDHADTKKINYQDDLFRRDIHALAADYKWTRVLDFDSAEKFPIHDSKMFQEGGGTRSNCHLSDQGSVLFSDMLAQALKEAMDRAGGAAK